jgi:hypothetical protein
MTSLRHRLGGLFSALSSGFLGEFASGKVGRTVMGIGLALLVGGVVHATEVERGEAEQAPPDVVGDPAPALVEPSAPVNPSRVVAHTAQLPKATKTPGKPLLAADLSRPSSAQGITTTPQSPGSGQPADGSTAATKTKLTAAKGGTAAPPARRTHLSLAPSSAEIRREIAARNGGPPTVNSANPSAAGKPQASTGERLQEQATAPPQQNKTWPTHVDYSAGPTGPAGGSTAADRKGAMIEASGPQQGVLRNRW